jgi:hypothetical protein
MKRNTLIGVVFQNEGANVGFRGREKKRNKGEDENKTLKVKFS